MQQEAKSVDILIREAREKERQDLMGKAKKISSRKTWTIMVYMAGDNNLAEEMVYALKSMYSVGSTEDYSIFALFDVGLHPVTFEIPDRAGRKTFIKSVPRRQDERSFLRETRLLDGPVTENSELLRKAEALLGKALNKAKAKGRDSLELSPVQSVVQDFIKSSIWRSPAHHYMLVLSGHGSGAVGDFLAARRRPNGLTIPGLGEMFEDVENHFKDVCDVNNLALYSKMDILGLDSCQMSTAEVAYEVRTHVHFLVGAEGFQPNRGWPYDQVLNRLNTRILEELALEVVRARAHTVATTYGLQTGPYSPEKIEPAVRKTILKEAVDVAKKAISDRIGEKVDFSKDDPRISTAVEERLKEIMAGRAYKKNGEVFPPPLDLAQAIVREHVSFYSADYSLADVSTDLAALDLTRIDEVAHQLSKLSDLLISAITGNTTESEVLRDAIILAHWEAQGYKSEQNVDLWDFCDCLSKRCSPKKSNPAAQGIATACTDLQYAISHNSQKANPDKLVVLSGYCGPAFQHSYGMSIYFPWTKWTDAAGVSDLDHYQTLKFAMDTRWDEFLKEYTTVTQRSPRGNRDAEHESALNRRDWLYTTEPQGIRDRFRMHDGNFEVGEKFTLSIERYEVAGKEVRLPNGQVTVFAGRLHVEDRRFTVKDGEFIVQGTVDKKHVEYKGQNGTFTVKDGTFTVQAGKFRNVKDGGTFGAKDGIFTIKDGIFTIKGGEYTAKDGIFTIKGDDFTAKDGIFTIKGGGFGDRGFSIKGGDFTAKDGIFTIKDGIFTIKDGIFTIKDGDTVKGASAGLTQIASMKNPPFKWNDCDLIAPPAKS